MAPLPGAAWRVFQERVVVPTWPTWQRRRAPVAFGLSDWFQFGLRADIVHLWDLQLTEDHEGARYFETKPRPKPDKIGDLLCRYKPEQYLWLGCLRKHGEVPCEHIWDRGAHNRYLDELVLANN